MTIDREELAAFVDGELDEMDRALIARAIEADPVLAREVEAQRALRVKLASHFAPIVGERIPDRLTALLVPEETVVEETVVDMAEARERREARRWLPSWGVGSAIAAALVVGVGVGSQLEIGRSIVSRDGALIASARLDKALDTQLASAQGNMPVRMLVSFRNNEGQLCRAFHSNSFDGIACRAGSDWTIRNVSPTGVAPRGEYRQAGSTSIMAVVQDMAAGEPLDAAAEAAARERGWK